MRSNLLYEKQQQIVHNSILCQRHSYISFEVPVEVKLTLARKRNTRRDWGLMHSEVPGPTNDWITQEESLMHSLITPLSNHHKHAVSCLWKLCVLMLWNLSTNLMLKALETSLSTWPKLSWAKPSGFGSYPPKRLHKVHVLLLAQWQLTQFHTAAQHPGQSPTLTSPASKHKTNIIFKNAKAFLTLLH